MCSIVNVFHCAYIKTIIMDDLIWKLNRFRGRLMRIYLWNDETRNRTWYKIQYHSWIHKWNYLCFHIYLSERLNSSQVRASALVHPKLHLICITLLLLNWYSSLKVAQRYKHFLFLGNQSNTKSPSPLLLYPWSFYPILYRRELVSI